MQDGGASRRSFLKLSGAAALLSTVERSAAASGAVQEAASAAGQARPGVGSLVELANPLQGTNSTRLFSRGNTLPIVAVPFGMAHWTLQSSDDSSFFFQPQDERVQGIRCTHQLSPWLGDYGDATFLPFSGEPAPEASARASSYRAAEMKIAPHLLEMELMRYRCRLELAPTERCALLRLTFAQAGPAGVFVDLPGEDATARYDATRGMLIAQTRSAKKYIPGGGITTYYVVRCDAPVTGLEVKELRGRRVAMLRFAAQAGKTVTLRVGTSFISADQAELNLTSEIGEKPLEQVRSEAAAVWNEALGRVQIGGASETQRRVFYSCLYRALLFPRIFHERDAQGKLVHFSAFSGKVEPGVMYADHGYWDDYRAWNPMMALLYPERLSEILEGWVNAYKEGGWLPRFPCPGYASVMTGDPIEFVFGDAVARGIQGFDLEAAYAALKKSATVSAPPKAGYGRPAIAEYEKLGYIPCEAMVGAVAETLDCTLGDFCIAQVARAAGHTDDAAMFEKRAQNWHKLFDKETRFLRGRMADGSWQTPFDPHTWGGPYVEGAAWQYRFSVPFDPEGLMQAMGGRDAFVGALDEMLNQPPVFHVGTYGREIHEMSEMAAVNFGQYAHSNQPVHHVLYMYSAAGRRDRTQHWVHRVLNELYSVDNFCGDEDTGAMSAWYILSAMGIFALCPGKPEWTLGAPLFERVEIHRADGRTIHIEAHAKQRDAFLDRVTLNGRTVRGSTVPHAALVEGGWLVFTQS